jgi:hypothetical protein
VVVSRERGAQSRVPQNSVIASVTEKVLSSEKKRHCSMELVGQYSTVQSLESVSTLSTDSKSVSLYSQLPDKRTAPGSRSVYMQFQPLYD